MNYEAQCKKSILHDFEISRDLPDALIEICNFCGKKEIYKKVKGRVDDAKYLRLHLRDTLQPGGRTGELFKKIYGTKGKEGIERAKRWHGKRIEKENRKDLREDLRERRLFLRRKALGHPMIRGKGDVTLPPIIKRTGIQ